MTSNRRERQLAREKYERQQERRAKREVRRRRNQRIVAAVVVIGLVGGGVALAITSATSTPPVTPSALASAIASNIPSPEASAPSSAASPQAPSTEEPIGEEDCTTPGTVRADDISFAEPGAVSDASLVSQESWLSFQTNCGDVVIRTDPKAPKTVASMAFLAESGYFDGTACHRVTTEGIFVLQCGDPRGNGSGGPGYAIPDENLPAEGQANYPAGTVAMANAGPGTGGSQFFIVYKDTTLPSGYTVWGQVESGLDIVERIAGAGVQGGGGDGRPAQPVVIDRATISPIPS